MSALFDRAAFEAHIGSLPHAFVVHQWGDASVGKVGSAEKSKIFAILSNWSRPEPAIAFKCSPMSFEMLKTLDDVRPAPYLARAGWVQVGAANPLTNEELIAYIAQAHAMIWNKLPARQRKALTGGAIEGVPA